MNLFKILNSKSIKIIIFILMPSLPACANEAVDLQLIDRFNQYYEYEKTHAWGKAYEMRTPQFRKVVDREYYIKQMEIDYSGFDLLNYKIIGHDFKSSDTVTFRVKFTHDHPKSKISESRMEPDGSVTYKLKFDGKSDGKISNFEANSIWKKIDGVWYVHDAATRIKLTLNAGP